MSAFELTTIDNSLLVGIGGGKPRIELRQSHAQCGANLLNGLNGTKAKLGKAGEFGLEFKGEIEKPFKNDPLAKTRGEK